MTETPSSMSPQAGTDGPAASATPPTPEPAKAPPVGAAVPAAGATKSPPERSVLPWVLVWLVLGAVAVFVLGSHLGLFGSGGESGAAALETQVRGIEGRIATLERTAGEAAARAQLTKLEERIAGLERTAATVGASPDLVRDLAALKGSGEAIARRLETLEGKVATPLLPPEAAARLGATEAATKAATEQRASLVSQLEGIDQSLHSHEAAMAALTAEDRRFTHELARLQEGLAMLSAGERAASEGAAGVGRMQALLFALAELRDRLRGGAPFTAELATVQAVAGDDKTVAEALAKLGSVAAKGVATVETLRTRFDPVAADMARADWVDGEGEWWSDAVHRLSSLVTVRRTGPDVTGNSAEAVAARAEWRLRQGDLAGAVGAFNGLEGPGAKVAAGWLTEAKGRLAADETLAELTRYALKQAAANP